MVKTCRGVRSRRTFHFGEPHQVLFASPETCVGALEPEDLIEMDLDGKVDEAKTGLQPTSETLMHLEAYR